jgi:hypothetical protein
MRSIKAILTISFAISLQSLCSAQTTFHWRQISGPVQTIIVSPDSANTKVTGLNQVGIYGYEFSVTNMFGTASDTCTITAVAGSLSVKPDSVYHFKRPKIKKLDIKMIARSSDIYVQIKSPKVQQVTCFLLDVLGRKLAKVDMQVNEGTNFISIPKPQISGVYILHFQTYFEVVTQKIII